MKKPVDKVQQEELVEVDCGEVCKYYRAKSNGDIDMQYALAQDYQETVDFKEKAVGTIFSKGDKKSHHYGHINILYNNQKYRIVINTITEDSPKKDKDVIEIKIGVGLQTDRESCKTFVLNMMKTLLKDDGKIAKSLIEFYNNDKNKEPTNKKDVTSDAYNAYSVLKKNFDKLKQECEELRKYNALDEFIGNIKKYVFDKNGKFIGSYNDVYNFLSEKVIYIYFMSGLSKEDLEKGPNLLSGISNDNFSKWEYAGEFLKLSQHPIFHKFDDKVTIRHKGNTITLKDYSNFYTASGGNVDSITRQIETLEKTNKKLKKEIEELKQQEEDVCWAPEVNPYEKKRKAIAGELVQARQT